MEAPDHFIVGQPHITVPAVHELGIVRERDSGHLQRCPERLATTPCVQMNRQLIGLQRCARHAACNAHSELPVRIDHDLVRSRTDALRIGQQLIEPCRQFGMHGGGQRTGGPRSAVSALRLQPGLAGVAVHHCSGWRLLR